MADHKEGLLDPIEAPAETPVSEAPAEQPVKAEVKPEPAKPDKANAPERPDGYVPREALSRVQSELQAERAARERAETNFQKWLDRWHAENQPQQEEPPPPPKWAENPLEAGEYQEQRINSLAAEFQQLKQQQEEQRQRDAMFRHSVADVNHYGQEVPQVHEAMEFLRQHGVNWFLQKGWHPAAIDEQLNKWQLEMAQRAHAGRVRPAEMFMLEARRLGWRPNNFAVQKPEAAPVPEAEAKELPERDATGRFVSAEAQKAARIKESQERNGSLSQAPGAPVEKVSAKEIAKMDERGMWDEFHKMRRSKQFDKEMGFR